MISKHVRRIRSENGKKNRRHGCSNPPTPEYRVWQSMLDRCRRNAHPFFCNYGGRGISVCRRWRKFELFFRDMGSRPTLRHWLERKDNSKGYSPKNCVWATASEQANNRRNNIVLSFDGISLTKSQWARRIGIPVSTLEARLSRGWGLRRALCR